MTSLWGNCLRDLLVMPARRNANLYHISICGPAVIPLAFYHLLPYVVHLHFQMHLSCHSN